MKPIEIIALVEFFIICVFCFDWWQRAGEEARKDGALRDDDKPVVIWPEVSDYDVTAVDFEADAFHEECGDR